MALREWKLTQWEFALGESGECLSAGRPVQVPHTWSVEEEGQAWVGKGWYRTVLPEGSTAPGERVFLRLRGAYRDAEVFANGKRMGSHTGSGYTPFTVELTQALEEGKAQTVTVSVDNRFSQQALPYDRSFDWANDGGLYRPAEILVTGPAAIRNARIQSRPILPEVGERQTAGPAVFGFCLSTDGTEEGAVLEWKLLRGARDSMTPVSGTPAASGILPLEKTVRLNSRILDSVVYWHFDRPELYTLEAEIRRKDGTLSDRQEWVIGFREMKVKGERWFLNGEPVRLPGTEWMPGSDPECGMAESTDGLERMLRVLKESNSVLTRFHWQQDDAVYDWCDRHGMLVQEEIPFWGKQPEGDPDSMWETACQQLHEMIEAHRNHPSIVAWGVGNELSAQTWPVQRYIRRAVACAHAEDPTRMANYVTNTAFGCPAQDGTGDGDLLMINDYIGTWHQGFEQDSAWKSLLDAHPGRVFVPSEFGLCEPAFSGGDPRREQIFLEKTAFYRTIPQIAGTIWFCLNDYRTHMGEEGEGRMKRRVHGSCDLFGQPKPSYWTVQREYAPLKAERTDAGILLRCRDDLPSYSVQGYMLKDGENCTVIPDLKPGESWFCEDCRGDEVCILRPNGDFVLRV